MDRKSVFLLFFLLSACTFTPLSSPNPSGAIEEQALVLPSGTSYTTIAEVLKHPTLFDGRQVRLKGRVVGVESHSSRTESPSTTFDLGDKNGNVVKVVIEARAPVRKGQEVTVEGRPAVHSTSSSFDVVVADARIISTSSHSDAVAPAASKPKRQEGRVF